MFKPSTFSLIINMAKYRSTILLYVSIDSLCFIAPFFLFFFFLVCLALSFLLFLFTSHVGLPTKTLCVLFYWLLPNQHYPFVMYHNLSLSDINCFMYKNIKTVYAILFLHYSFSISTLCSIVAIPSTFIYL